MPSPLSAAKVDPSAYIYRKLYHMTTAVAATPLPDVCRHGEGQAILARLKQLTAGVASSEAPSGNGGGDDDDAAPPGTVVDYQDADGRTAFHWCVGLRNFTAAEQLLQLGARVCTHDKDGTTPLMSACAVDAPIAFIDRVVARAAEEASAMGGLVPYMASTDGAGNSALILAASKGSVAIVKKLLALGVDVLYQNKRGQNALHRAVSRGHLETAEELLSYSKRQLGSNGKAADIGLSVVAEASPSPVPPYRKFVNCRDAQGNTPLHYASMENNKELGQLLLRYGADRTIRNNDGKEFWEL